MTGGVESMVARWLGRRQWGEVVLVVLVITSALQGGDASKPERLTLWFTGNSSIAIPNSFDFPNLTVSMWFNSQNIRETINVLWSNRIPGCNANSDPEQDPSSGISLFLNEWSTDNRQLIVEGYTNNTGTYGCLSWRSAINLVRKDVWLHIALVTERNGATTVFLNGELVKSLDATDGDSGGQLPVNVDTPLFNLSTVGEFLPTRLLGRQNFGFRGLIDELSFWKKSLDSTEIRKLLSDSIIDKSDPFLVSYFTFDDGTLKDKVGGFHAINNGRAPVQYHLVSLGRTCGNGFVDVQFEEQCDGGSGCSDSCTCEGGWFPATPAKADCLQIVALKKSTAIAVMAVDLVTTVPVIALLVFFLIKRKESPFTAATPLFCLFTLLGAIMLNISTVFLANGIVFSCYASLWLVCCGCIFLFGSLVVKTWRIERLFHTDISKLIRITDLNLLTYFSVLLGIEFVLLIVLTATVNLVPISSLPVDITAPALLGCAVYPLSPTYSPLLIIQLVYIAFLLLAGCVIAFRVRNVPLQNVREGREIIFSAYNFTLLFIIVGIIDGVISEPNTQLLITSIGIILATSLSIVALFWSKVYKILTGKDLWKASIPSSRNNSTTVTQ